MMVPQTSFKTPRTPRSARVSKDVTQNEIYAINHKVARALGSSDAAAEPPEPAPLSAPAVSVEASTPATPSREPIYALLRPSNSLASAELNKPACVAVLPTGDLCCADTAADTLLVLSAHDHSVRLRLNGAEAPYGVGGPLRQPRGVACDATALYVSEVGGSRVRKMRLPEEFRVNDASTPRGSHLGGVPLDVPSAADGSLTFPQGLATADNELYVCDCEDHRVAVYDTLTLSYVRSIGEYGSEEGELSHPYACAVLGDELCVCDVANDRLSLFHRASGAFLRTLGAAFLHQPRAVAHIALPTPADAGSAATPAGSAAAIQRRGPGGAAEGQTALLVCEQTRLLVLSLCGNLLQCVSVDGAVDMWSVCVSGGSVYVTDKGAPALHVLALDDVAPLAPPPPRASEPLLSPKSYAATPLRRLLSGRRGRTECSSKSAVSEPSAPTPAVPPLAVAVATSGPASASASGAAPPAAGAAAAPATTPSTSSSSSLYRFVGLAGRKLHRSPREQLHRSPREQGGGEGSGDATKDSKSRRRFSKSLIHLEV